MKKNRTLTILLVITLALGWWLLNINMKNRKIIDSLGEEVESYRNENGEHVARIEYLEQENVSSFLKIKSKDSTIIALQESVKKYKKQLKKGGSVTRIEGTTRIDTVIQEVTVDTEGDMPIYFGKVDFDQWGFAEVEAHADGISVDLEMKNLYTIVMGREPSGFLGLGKGRLFAEVTNHNPYSETTSIKTFSVTDTKPKKWGIGIGVGYGLNLESIEPRPTLMVGLTYNLIRF